MAQQLSTLRTPAAYAGVEKYAHTHDGEASAAAYLAAAAVFGVPTGALAVPWLTELQRLFNF